MKITVEYFNGKLPILKKECTTSQWSSLTLEGVQRVIIQPDEYTHFILSGYDYYWVNEEGFGLFNDPTSTDYRGKMAGFFTLKNEKIIDLGEKYPPPGTHCLPGSWMPNELYHRAYGHVGCKT